MGLLSTWSLEGWRLDQIVAPGERVLALTPTALPPDESVLPGRRGPAKTAEPRALRALDAIWSIATLPLRPLTMLADALLSAFSNNPSVHGPDGSAARTISAAIGSDAALLYLAVTESRLLVLRGERLSQTEPFRLVAEVGRDRVTAVEVRSKLLTASFGRLRVTFPDGSWLEFADGFEMGRRRATQVRDAIIDGRVAVSGTPRPPRR